MLVHHKFVRAFHVGIDRFGDKRHFRNLFNDGCVINGIRPVFAERKNAVALYKYARYFQRIKLFTEFFYDRKPRILFVFTFDLRFRKRSCTGNITIKIIGMCRSVKGYVPSRLRPGGCKRGMGMRNPAYALKSLIKFEVRWRIGRRIKISTTFPFKSTTTMSSAVIPS